MPPDYQMVKTAGGSSLYHRSGTCGPPPEDFDDMLEGADDMGLERGSIAQPNPHQLSIHAGSSAAAFVSGWGNGEHFDCRHARWAVSTHASMVFPLTPSDALYSLTFTAQPYGRAAPQSVRITLN